MTRKKVPRPARGSLVRRTRRSCVRQKPRYANSTVGISKLASIKMRPTRPPGSLFEHNLIGVYRTSLSGKILDCNESMATIMGFRSREELLAHRSTELYYARSDRAAFIRRLRQQRKLVNFELTLRRQDNTPVHILENVVLLPDERGNLSIIQGTMVDISDRKRAEDFLRASEEKHKTLANDLRKLTQRLQHIREEERARIARELHDELGQTLTALNLDLHWLRSQLARTSPAANMRLAAMSGLIKETMHSVRRICADLRPRVLDDLGLLPAVEWLVRDFRKATGIRCRLMLSSGGVHAPPDQATDVFRVVQEALTNAARHAQATHIAITVSIGHGRIAIRVADNGIGIAPENAGDPLSFGLAGMRERTLRWEGLFEIQRRPRGGTVVIAQVPIARGSVESRP